MPRRAPTHRGLKKRAKTYEPPGSRQDPERWRPYSGHWRKARRAYLLENPLCVHCLKRGKRTPANEVDHITPHEGDMTLFWDESNWQALCKPCHSRKTLGEIKRRI